MKRLDSCSCQTNLANSILNLSALHEGGNGTIRYSANNGKFGYPLRYSFSPCLAFNCINWDKTGRSNTGWQINSNQEREDSSLTCSHRWSLWAASKYIKYSVSLLDTSESPIIIERFSIDTLVLDVIFECSQVEILTTLMEVSSEYYYQLKVFTRYACLPSTQTTAKYFTIKINDTFIPRSNFSSNSHKTENRTVEATRIIPENIDFYSEELDSESEKEEPPKEIVLLKEEIFFLKAALILIFVLLIVTFLGNRFKIKLDNFDQQRKICISKIKQLIRNRV